MFESRFFLLKGAGIKIQKLRLVAYQASLENMLLDFFFRWDSAEYARKLLLVGGKKQKFFAGQKCRRNFNWSTGRRNPGSMLRQAPQKDFLLGLFLRLPPFHLVPVHKP